MIPAQTDPIKHVVLLILENHSFDQMLGCFQGVFPDVEGVDSSNPRSNDDGRGNTIYQSEMRETQMVDDPIHEHPDVLEQISSGNSGFVKNFTRHYPASSLKERQAIMGYYPRGFLPALHTLAEHFTICDHWFSSLPGPTWPNRFFALSGTCSGDVEMLPAIDTEALGNIFSIQSQDTIFDRLEEAGRGWNIFYYDIASSLLLDNLRRPDMSSKYLHVSEFFRQCEASETEFPDFVFIEPKYYGLDQNDDHPPHNVMKAQKLIADVYNALRSNDALWESCLLVLFYDEHGGFYDHVVPPKAVPPDGKTERYSFDQYGVRVPALLISPWAPRRVEKCVFDHTSLIKYLTEKWSLRPLTERSKAANSIECALGAEKRADTPQFIRVPYTDLIPSHPEWELSDISVHHSAFDRLADRIFDAFEESAEAALLREAAEPGGIFLKVKKFLGPKLVSLGYRWSRPAVDRAEQRAENLFDVLRSGLPK